MTLGVHRRLSAVIVALAAVIGVLFVTVAPAQAADAVSVSCSLRSSTGVQFFNTNDNLWWSIGCGQSYNAPGSNTQTYVRDVTGPICVYFGSTLAGCASINGNAYIGNRGAGQTAIVKPQPLGSAPAP